MWDDTWRCKSPFRCKTALYKQCILYIRKTWKPSVVPRMKDRWSTSLCCWSMSSTLGSETSWWGNFPHTFNILCWFLSWAKVSSCCVASKGDQQQHGSAAPDRVLRGDLFKDVQVLGASAWCGLFPAAVWWDLCDVFLRGLKRRACFSCTNWKWWKINRITCVHQGFTEEFIDEFKETLSSSNLYMLAMAALVTAVQVRFRRIKH